MDFRARDGVVAVSELLRLHVLGTFFFVYAFRRRQQQSLTRLRRSSLKANAVTSSSRDGILIIAPGLGRSGTVSLAVALEMLGFPTYHEISMVQNLDRHNEFWKQAVKQGSADRFWQQAGILRGYKAICGLPAACFYRELLVAYPDAKVVLKVRHEEAWYDSVLHTIVPTRVNLWNCILFKHAVEAFVMPYRELPAMARLCDKTYSVEHFRRFIEEVKTNVPAQQLLVHDITDGWEPLCKFLDVEIPSEPYPWANKCSDFNAAFQSIRVFTQCFLGCVVLLVSMVLFYIFTP